MCLPDLAVRPDVLTPESVADVQRIAQELKVVKWELPEGVEEIRFWPMGMDGRRSWPFADRLDRLLVVSPFLTDGFLTGRSAWAAATNTWSADPSRFGRSTPQCS